MLVENLERRFGDRIVVSGLELTVRKGERIAILGPNGSGKTTLLRCVAGTVTPTQGRVLVGGHAAGSKRARRALGVSLSQERSFYLRLSGRENLLFFAGVRGHRRAEAARIVRRLEDELSLRPILDQRVDRCSTGMIQQLSFARALIGEPPLLLLDEPTRSLDTAAADRFWGALDRRPGASLLIATHREEDLEHCDRSLSLSAEAQG